MKTECVEKWSDDEDCQVEKFKVRIACGIYRTYVQLGYLCVWSWRCRVYLLSGGDRLGSWLGGDNGLGHGLGGGRASKRWVRRRVVRRWVGQRAGR